MLIESQHERLHHHHEPQRSVRSLSRRMVDSSAARSSPRSGCKGTCLVFQKFLSREDQLMEPTSRSRMPRRLQCLQNVRQHSQIGSRSPPKEEWCLYSAPIRAVGNHKFQFPNNQFQLRLELAVRFEKNVGFYREEIKADCTDVDDPMMN